MRRRPYTATGIRRVPCIRCGDPSEHQWSACAVNNQWMPLCIHCDVKLNEVALTFVMGISKARPWIEAYRARAKA